ncbi:uroporphyrinogen decarboxylase family protein [uncultured Paludibaculum sp.]|uniref:uroporphyrinogen decarboxylase family protein n=1 Tax=uncultured Paludibaculum sp. TaxID=1765020 RepID=UPI002AAB1E17|nr:uroporphyrinogen decarboxylase family protein [uncultured Paludibaculum sp.]
MTGKERILAKIGGGETDSLPLMPITMMFAGDVAGIPYGVYAKNHEALVEAQLAAANRFDFDYVSAISDPAREAADLGASIEWFEDQPPAINESKALIHDKAVLATLHPPDPANGRMNDRVCAVRLLAQRAGADRIVEGWVEGPCAMAADLRGLNTLMLDFGDDLDFVEALFDYALRMELRFAQAQVDAGATLIGVGDAAASLVGPRIYQNVVLPIEKRLVAGIQAMGVPVRLHICGNTRRILKGMGEVGAEIVDLDFPAPVDEARAAMGARQVLLGNMDPVRALRDGTPESVTAVLAECHAQAGRGYIVGAGCEIPRGTPHENVEAMTRFARSRQ